LDQFINNSKILPKLAYFNRPYASICESFKWDETDDGYEFWSNLEYESNKKGIFARLELTNEEIINLINLSK